jgi:hypothetical protein
LKKIVMALAFACLVAVPVAGAKPAPGGTTGTARVFLPNPVADLQIQSLTDQDDADYAALQPAYHGVQLTNLDGSGYLSGDFAKVIAETGSPAYSSTNTFSYNRHQDEFEQVMAYYWVTAAQKYIQSLGFGVWRRPINNEPQDIRINQWGQDNSYSWDKHDVLRFGKGGVDDAEDAEVIVHEYGHAVMDSQQTTWQSPSRRSSRPRPTRRVSPTGTPSRTPRRCRTACGASTRTCATRTTSTGACITTA